MIASLDSVLTWADRIGVATFILQSDDGAVTLIYWPPTVEEMQVLKSMPWLLGNRDLSALEDVRSAAARALPGVALANACDPEEIGPLQDRHGAEFGQRIASMDAQHRTWGSYYAGLLARDGSAQKHLDRLMTWTSESP